MLPSKATTQSDQGQSIDQMDQSVKAWCNAPIADKNGSYGNLFNLYCSTDKIASLPLSSIVRFYSTLLAELEQLRIFL